MHWVEHAYQTRRRQIQAAQVLGVSEKEARESSESHYALVRRMGDRLKGRKWGRGLGQSGQAVSKFKRTSRFKGWESE